MIEFELNGRAVAVPVDAVSLLEALRDHLGDRSVKDGCSPQGQCGCCTVWVDGNPRVACVTPVGRVRGRRVTTVEGLDDARTWADRFCEAGASQCGFCTPGIVMRLAALDSGARTDTDAVNRALLAHLCRCTGWQPIVDACRATTAPPDVAAAVVPVRSLDDAARRAALEGGTSQTVDPAVALGRGGFADDTAPDGALVAMLGAGGDWVVAESVHEARAAAGKVQGRRSTAPLTWPIDLHDDDSNGGDGGDAFVARLQTTWVEPAYLEPDASWCAPGADPVTPLANGGAFGGKVSSPVAAAARRLADLHGRPVRVLLTREDTVRTGPKRPPVAGGIRADGTGLLRIARPAERADLELLRTRIAQVAPGLELDVVEVDGPPASAAIRAAGWAEAALLMSALDQADAAVTVTAPGGGSATARLDHDGAVVVTVRCGTPLDHAVLRSYCTGAAHMALGWIRSEGLAVDEHGVPVDLTIRSFGILRAVDMPRIDVQVDDDDGPPVNGSDAVFAAVAAAAWRAAGRPERIPVRGG